MNIRILMRSGMFILMGIGAAIGWLAGRRKTPAAPPPPVRITLPREVPALLDALRSPDWRVRYEAVRGLGKLDDPAVLGALVAALDDADSDVRDAAVESLAAMGETALPELVEWLYSGTLNGREAAARALGLIAAPAALEGLSGALHDESAWVRAAAVEALEHCGADAVPALAGALKDEDGDVRRAAQAALTRINTPQAKAALARQQGK